MESIEVVSVPVSDQQASKEFYLSIGFTLIYDNPMGNGTNWVQLGLPGGGAAISLVTWLPKMQPGTMQGLVLKTRDVEKEHAELKAKGVNIDAIDPTPWGKFATFYDPDGNSLILREE